MGSFTNHMNRYPSVTLNTAPEINRPKRKTRLQNYSPSEYKKYLHVAPSEYFLQEYGCLEFVRQLIVVAGSARFTEEQSLDLLLPATNAISAHKKWCKPVASCCDWKKQLKYMRALPALYIVLHTVFDRRSVNKTQFYSLMKELNLHTSVVKHIFIARITPCLCEFNWNLFDYFGSIFNQWLSPGEKMHRINKGDSQNKEKSISR